MRGRPSRARQLEEHVLERPLAAVFLQLLDRALAEVAAGFELGSRAAALCVVIV